MPDKALVAAIDEAYDAGELPPLSTYRKLLVVHTVTGVVEIKGDGDRYNGELYVPVDVTNISAPFVEPR